MITSDFVFKATSIRMGALWAGFGGTPGYAYQFDRETPVEGGIMRAPQTGEVPFIFGTKGARQRG